MYLQVGIFLAVQQQKILITHLKKRKPKFSGTTFPYGVASKGDLELKKA